MKILKPLLVFIILCLTLFSTAQNLKYQLYLNQGINELNMGNFSKADSLFDSSNEIYPHKDAYFNKAISSLSQKNKCGFCENMFLASFYGDQEADSLYNQHCLEKLLLFQSPYDSLFPIYTNKKYETVEKDFCGNRINIQFFDAYDSLIAGLKIVDKKYYYSNLSYAAQYPGGGEMIDKFIEHNLMYPEEAKKLNIQGRVYASFIVDKNGLVKDANIVIGVHKLLDEEVLRVIRLIPKFFPATKNGVPVLEVKTLNIDFAL